jgi:hypothetical protein
MHGRGGAGASVGGSVRCVGDDVNPPYQGGITLRRVGLFPPDKGG